MVDIFANDLVDMVREVENDILQAVIPILMNFQAETGFSIDDIWFQFENVTTVGSTHPNFILTKIHCDVALRN